MQLFSADATKLKVAQKNSNPLFFSLLPWAAQTAQKEEFMFQILVYRPTVNRTGIKELRSYLSEFQSKFAK